MPALLSVSPSIVPAVGKGDEGIVDLMGALWDEASKAAVF